MRPSFPTRDQLSAMSISRLRLVDVVDKEEEDLVQEILNSKVQAGPPPQEINRKDVPDIKTPEEEAKWQKKIDERSAKLRGAVKLPNQDASTSTTLPSVKENPPVKKAEGVASEVPDSDRPFCEFCDGKKKHKKGCPTLLVNEKV